MSCTTCKFYKPEDCVSECLQIYFKNDPPVRIHRSEVMYIKIKDKFLSIVDVKGTQHNYNLDIINHYHVPILQ